MTPARHAALACAVLLSACSADDTRPAPSTDGGRLDGTSLPNALTLELVAEKKLSKLLSTKDVDHYEASGIVASSGKLYVASDNSTRIAVIDTALDEGELGPGDAGDSQYEAITASDDGRFFTTVESDSDTNGPAQVAELDTDAAFVRKSSTDVSFEHANKGFEGVAWLRVAGQEYLLALCENNDCEDDDSPPGEGRAQLLTRVNDIWTTRIRLKLPKSVAFINYSDLALASNGDGTYRALVVSRKSSAIWIGTLTTSPWAFTGPSAFYTFPRSADGSVRYCSVEGITFLGPDVLAAVSDKSDDSKPCSDEEESIHVFQVPR